MTKPFVFLAALLMLMVFSMALHTVLFPYKKTSDSMHTIAKLTQLNTLSLSTAYDGASFNVTYPDMPTLGRMDFVYDK